MAHDLFEQLAASDVPPVPAEIDSQGHQRLNTVLLTAHLLEFALHAAAHAVGLFLRSVLYLAVFSLTGRMQDEGDISKID